MVAQRDPYEAPAIRAFGIALTTYRESLGLNKTELAEKLGCTPVYVGQVEAAKNVPSKPFAQDLDTFFKTGNLFHRLWQLIADTRYLVGSPPSFPAFVLREKAARELRMFEGHLVTGLFQTEAYARSLLASSMGPPVVDNALEMRMRRKEILSRDDPPLIFLVMHEPAIHRIVGSVEIMKEQLAHLLELGERRNINIQILPADTEYYAAFSGSFTLLKFEDSEDAAYTELLGLGTLTEDPRAVADGAIRYDLLRGHACSVPESRRLIRKALESL